MPAQPRVALLLLSLGSLAFLAASSRVDALDKDQGDSDLDADGLVSQEEGLQHSRSQWSPGFEPKSCLEASFKNMDPSVVKAYFGDRGTLNRVCGLAKIQSPYLPDLFNAKIQNTKEQELPGLNDYCLELEDDDTWKLFGEFQRGGKPDMAKVYEWGKEYSAALHARMGAHGACDRAETNFDVSRQYTDLFLPAFQWTAGFAPESCVETNPDYITIDDIDGFYGGGTFEEICELARTPVVSSRLFNPVLQRERGEIPGLNMNCLDNFGAVVAQFDGSAADSTKVQAWSVQYSAALFTVMAEGRSCG